MKTEACLPLVFGSRLERNPSGRRFLPSIRHKKKLDLRRPLAIGRGQWISGNANPVSSLLSRFWRRRKDREVGGRGGYNSKGDREAPMALLVGGGGVDGEGEEACRSFDKYVMEVILEEGRVGDLRDVEELLHCWNILLCPVLSDIVATFYVEACKELFAAD